LPGLETELALLLTAYNKGMIPLWDVIEKTSLNPAKIFGIKNKGFEVGKDADLIIVNLKEEWEVKPEEFYTKAKWSPFEGWKLKGKVKMTLLRGKVVMEDDEIIGKPRGKELLSRVELDEVWKEAKDIKAFRFNRKLDFVPGQFIMVWLPGVGEKPFSLADKDLILMKRVGMFTSKLFELKEGDYVWIRGPYGRGFEPRGKKVGLIAGGIGFPHYVLMQSITGNTSRKLS